MPVAMTKLSPRICDRAGCGKALGPTQRQYCSRQCYALARRVGEERVCALEGCNVVFYPKPGEVAKGGGRYCCQAHGNKARRLQQVCAQCGAPFHSRWGRQKYCSTRCTGDAKRKGWPERRCITCGKPFRRPPSQMGPRARFCSMRCRGNSRAPLQELTCACCGIVFLTSPWRVAHGRQFCSRRCYLGEAVWHEVTCARPGCGTVMRVTEAQQRGGRGKYCSRACRGLAQRTLVKKRRRCAYDQKLFVVLEGNGSRPRRYCGRAHYNAARRRAVEAKTPISCAACGAAFIPHRHEQQYCSLSCSDRGRAYARPASIAARNQRILELKAAGWKARKIAEHLAAERADWILTPSTVRSVVLREPGRQEPPAGVAPERDATLLSARGEGLQEIR